MSDVQDLTVRILRSIRDEVAGTNARLDQTNARLDEVNVRLGRVEQSVGRLEQSAEQTNARLGRLEHRFDHLLDFAGERYRTLDERTVDHERRISRLEGKPPAGPGR